jgi:DNA repair protein SbcD/Mre11
VIRLLHTSDWHLGLELGGHDRLPEQQRFLEWLLETSVERRVDALLVAGDVYDVANPSVAAQEVFARFLVEFRRRLPAASVVVVAGNHDSGSRLELPRPFCESLGGIHLVGGVTPPPGGVDRHLVVLRDGSGRAAAVCLAVPFLRTTDVDCRLREGETPEQAFARCVDAFYAALREVADFRHPDLPVVAMGHLALAGSDRGGSERILIGGLESVPGASIARHADYVALGHIHRGQKAGAPHALYSGSPLSMDFDERRYTHRVLVVELDGRGSEPRIEAVPVPEFVPLLRFPEKAGSWEEMERAVTDFDWSPWRDHPESGRPLVELQFLSTGLEADLRARTQALCADRPFRLVGSPRALSPHGKTSPDAPHQARDLSSDRAPLEIFERHWRRANGNPPPDDLLACFCEIVDQVRTAGGA